MLLSCEFIGAARLGFGGFGVSGFRGFGLSPQSSFHGPARRFAEKGKWSTACRAPAVSQSDQRLLKEFNGVLVATNIMLRHAGRTRTKFKTRAPQNPRRDINQNKTGPSELLKPSCEALPELKDCTCV